MLAVYIVFSTNPLICSFRNSIIIIVMSCIVRKSPFRNIFSVNTFLANFDFYCLLITYANRLDPDQDRQNVGPGLDPNGFTL